jgi:hypothetical protein
MASGTAIGGYNFNHRVRFMMNLRYALPKLKTAIGTPFVATANEVLINFGREVIYNSLDQNRLSLLTGIQGKGWSFQIGYMNRYVQLASGNKYVANHTLLLWLTQTFDFRKKPTTKTNGVKHI